MKKAFLLLFFISGAVLFAKEATHSVSETTYFNNQSGAPKKKENKKVIHSPSQHKQVAAMTHSRIGQSEVMIINPEMRAKDFQESFLYLKKIAPASKLAVKLVNGTMISEILDMKLMPGGTMIIFQTNSIQGQKYEVIKIEDIDTLTNV